MNVFVLSEKHARGGRESFHTKKVVKVPKSLREKRATKRTINVLMNGREDLEMMMSST